MKYRPVIKPVLFLIFCLGCAAPTPETTGNQSDSADLMKQAEKEFVRGEEAGSENLEKAFRLSKKYIRRHPNGKEVGEAWFRIAQIQFISTNYRKADRAIQNGLKKVKRPQVRGALLKWKGRVLWKLEQYSEAREAFREATQFIDDQPDGGAWVNRANLLRILANAQIRTRQFDKGKQTLETILREYPNSPTAKRAKEDLLYLQDFFSVQVGAFEKKKNARKRIRELQQKRLDPYITTVQYETKTLYCIRIGRFNTYRKAKAKMNQLKRKGFDTYIVP